jgi:hypothetical protein
METNKVVTEKLPHNYKGICPECCLPVYHAYPWYTGNPRKQGARPYHDACWTAAHCGDESCALGTPVSGSEIT